jgi:hypothetical protein
MIIGGEKKMIVTGNEPAYSATYEIESPDVLTNPAWGAAVDQGWWLGQVRPSTKNRRHVLCQRILT